MGKHSEENPKVKTKSKVLKIFLRVLLVILIIIVILAGIAAGLVADKLGKINVEEIDKTAIGISEESDAIAIIVSEETGRISIAINGNLNYNLSVEEAKLKILDELKPKKTAEFDYEVEELEGDEDE